MEETDAAVTGLGGVSALVNLAHEMRLFRDVDALLPPKERLNPSDSMRALISFMEENWAKDSIYCNGWYLHSTRGSQGGA